MTRIKCNAVYKLLECRQVNRKSGITSKHIIEIISRGKRCSCGASATVPRNRQTLRVSGQPFPAFSKTIANIYKARWEIELFNKKIKQNPRIKSFVGNSENAVQIQIYTALTVYLPLAHQKFPSRLGLSLQKLFQLIQLNLLGGAFLEEMVNPP